MEEPVQHEPAKISVFQFFGNESDWWVIWKVNHEGKREMRPMPSWMAATGLWTSARLGDGFTDIEGTASEMHDLATAIEQKGAESHRRCSAEWTEKGVLLSSPRNSYAPVLVPHENALELAADIRLKVPRP